MEATGRAKGKLTVRVTGRPGTATPGSAPTAMSTFTGVDLPPAHSHTCMGAVLALAVPAPTPARALRPLPVAHMGEWPWPRPMGEDLVSLQSRGLMLRTLFPLDARSLRVCVLHGKVVFAHLFSLLPSSSRGPTESEAAAKGKGPCFLWDLVEPASLTKELLCAALWGY